MASGDASLRSHFADLGRNPDSWLSSALMLKQVTDLIWWTPDWAGAESTEGPMQHVGDMTIWPVGLMLAGLALELLVKGLLIVNNPALVTAEKLDAQLTKHALARYLEEASIVLEEEEVALVKRLEEFITWAGRYPIPTKFMQRKAPPMLSTSDPIIFQQLFARLSQKLDTKRHA